MGISILAIMALTDFNYFERSHQISGYDFWLDKVSGKEWRQIERKKLAKLEISGIWKESSSNSVNMRVSKKLKQVKKATSQEELPIMISIIEFFTPKAKIITK